MELRCPRSQGDGVAACRRVGERGLCGERSGWLGFNETSLALHWLAWTATGIGQQAVPRLSGHSTALLACWQGWRACVRSLVAKKWKKGATARGFYVLGKNGSAPRLVLGKEKSIYWLI
jgi:hypothetical protein